MKRNWYAAIILLALCVLLFRAGQYVDRTTAGMQRQLEAAYALAEQGDYPAARRAYSRAANRALRSTQVLGLLVRRNILDQLNQTLAVLPPFDSLVARSLLLVGAIVLNALATGMYIGAGFGPGPRDGLMTGLHARTGWSLRGIRTVIEVSVLLIGWMMGGKLGVGTVLYALTIGPLIQLCLPWFHQPVARKALAKPGEAIS